MEGKSIPDGPSAAVWLLWLAIFVGLPALVAGYAGGGGPQGVVTASPLVRAGKVRSIPPPVEPVEVYALEREDAKALNAAVPFSREPNPAARPFLFEGSETDLARATDCLAAAQIYEAGDDPVGERAVAQVVLNRVRHPAFPKTVCGVVFQGQERQTGCQFTFSCDGALSARTPSPTAWERARAIAREMLAGKVYAPVGYATHYHTDWVVPYWSSSLTKIAAVDTHLFFRWQGWWGTPGAFRRSGVGGEPLIGRIARFSIAHAGAPDAVLTGAQPPAMPTNGAALLAARPVQAIGPESIGKSFSAGRLTAIGPGAKTFLLELAHGPLPDDWPELAQTFCAGRDECRIMAWRSGAPLGFPLSSGQINGMAFAYIHNARSGLQRVLWNCTLYPRAVKRECMRIRDPANAPPPVATTRSAGQTAAIPTLDGVRRKDRFETVRIAPPPSGPAPALPPSAN